MSLPQHFILNIKIDNGLSMSERIALICKGFKSLKDSNDLKYLDNSVGEVVKVLDSYWDVQKPYIVNDTGGLKNKIESFGEDFSEFLFYYIGHGVVENNKFYIVGHDNDRIHLKDILLLTEQWNKKVTIILDACYSGQFINEWDNKVKYEILSSSDTQVAYEDPTYKMAFFTYNFCSAIERNKQYIELSVENIYNEINAILAARQKCTHYKVKSFNHVSNTILRNPDSSIMIPIQDQKVMMNAKKLNKKQFSILSFFSIFISIFFILLFILKYLYPSIELSDLLYSLIFISLLMTKSYTLIFTIRS